MNVYWKPEEQNGERASSTINGSSTSNSNNPISQLKSFNFINDILTKNHTNPIREDDISIFRLLFMETLLVPKNLLIPASHTHEPPLIPI